MRTELIDNVELWDTVVANLGYKAALTELLEGYRYRDELRLALMVEHAEVGEAVPEDFVEWVVDGFTAYQAMEFITAEVGYGEFRKLTLGVIEDLGLDYNS